MSYTLGVYEYHWYTSLTSPLSPPPSPHPHPHAGNESFVGSNDDDSTLVESTLASAHDRWRDQVVRDVPPARLLLYYPGDGYAPLCAFLGIDKGACPTDPPPMAWNSGKQFSAAISTVEFVCDTWPLPGVVLLVLLAMLLRACCRCCGRGRGRREKVA